MHHITTINYSTTNPLLLWLLMKKGYRILSRVFQDEEYRFVRQAAFKMVLQRSTIAIGLPEESLGLKITFSFSTLDQGARKYALLLY